MAGNRQKERFGFAGTGPGHDHQVPAVYEVVADRLGLMAVGRIVYETRQFSFRLAEADKEIECGFGQAVHRRKAVASDIFGCRFQVGNAEYYAVASKQRFPLRDKRRGAYMVGRLDIVLQRAVEPLNRFLNCLHEYYSPG